MHVTFSPANAVRAGRTRHQPARLVHRSATRPTWWPRRYCARRTSCSGTAASTSWKPMRKLRAELASVKEWAFDQQQFYQVRRPTRPRTRSGTKSCGCTKTGAARPNCSRGSPGPGPPGRATPGGPAAGGYAGAVSEQGWTVSPERVHKPANGSTMPSSLKRRMPTCASFKCFWRSTWAIRKTSWPESSRSR